MKTPTSTDDSSVLSGNEAKKEEFVSYERAHQLVGQLNISKQMKYIDKSHCEGGLDPNMPKTETPNPNWISWESFSSLEKTEK